MYETLRTPSTARRILIEARKTAPSITYQDIRHILRDFERQNISVCLNPEQSTGRLHMLKALLPDNPIASTLIELCSIVDRSRIKLAVLREAARPVYEENKPLTVTQIKKRLRDTYPLALNHAYSALRSLLEGGLVRVAGHTDKRDLNIYAITDLGREVLSFLDQE
ncbi:PadR family transcriptional regulator [Pontiellaceae bacterium B12219]|nr:PadR family transcriptional regulator [Pontiellaceae bacterium B12219]